jgi:hypothetical protein
MRFGISNQSGNVMRVEQSIGEDLWWGKPGRLLVALLKSGSMTPTATLQWPRQTAIFAADD